MTQWNIVPGDMALIRNTGEKIAAAMR